MAGTWHREDSRGSWVGSGEAATERLWLELREKLGATEFLGYDTHVAEGQVVAIVVDGKETGEASSGTEAAIITNQTPFYGESGGQQGDIGAMFTATGGEFAVSDTQKRAGDLFVHLGKVTHGALKYGDVVELRIDDERRRRLRANHSVTHLLHQALRRRLGEHVTQKGSLVAPDRLRFDFSQPRALTDDDLHVVEGEVNKRIRENAEVTTRLMTPDQAIEQGAMALFGEKYGDEVRVVSMGEDVHDDHAHPFSVELCGGTHVQRTGDIGFFKIVGESAVASGVRRIEAVTGPAAEEYVDREEELLQEAANALRTSAAELPVRLAALLEERKKLERELSEARRAAATGGGAKTDAAKDIAGIKFAGRALDGVPAKELKSLADDLKREVGSGIVALVASAEGKASIVVGVTDDLVKRFSAVDLVRVGSEAVGGKGGGGRSDMAQAGGPDGGRINDALAAIEKAIAAKAAS